MFQTAQFLIHFRTPAVGFHLLSFVHGGNWFHVLRKISKANLNFATLTTTLILDLTNG